MVFRCLFDLLPAELLEELFSHFRAHEIFHSFYNVNEYLNAVIESYPNFSVHFYSSVHSLVDWTCQRLQPEQITSLTIDNNPKTRAQYDLLFSYFSLEQCTRLRSLTLTSDDTTWIHLYLTKLNSLQQLTSLSIFYETHQSANSNVLKPVAHLLTRLAVSQLNSLSLEIFPNLRYLKLMLYRIDDLQCICCQASRLQSLDIILRTTDLARLPLLVHLNRLRLTIGERLNEYKHEFSSCLVAGSVTAYVNMSEFENVLPLLTKLRHLELEVPVDNDLADGDRWRILTQSLRTFRFKIRLGLDSTSAMDSFQTPFWLEEKRWFVVSRSGWLFTEPSFREPEVTSLMYTLESDLPNQWNRLNSVRTLNLRCSLPLSQAMAMVNFDTVQHLIFATRSSLPMFTVLIPIATHLSRMSIHGEFISTLVQNIGKQQTFEQIRALELTFCYPEAPQMSERLARIFPRISYLNIALIDSMMHIVHLIQCFRYLSDGVFCIDSQFNRDKQSDLSQLQSEINHKRLSRNETFRCQILPSTQMSLLSSVYIWTSKPTRI